MYFLKIGCYDLTLCKTQTKPDRIIEDNIKILNLYKICECLLYNNPIKVKLK